MLTPAQHFRIACSCCCCSAAAACHPYCCTRLHSFYGRTKCMPRTCSSYRQAAQQRHLRQTPICKLSEVSQASGVQDSCTIQTILPCDIPLRMYIYIYTYVCTYINTYLHTYTHMNQYIHIYMFVHVGIYVYTNHIRIYIYTYSGILQDALSEAHAKGCRGPMESQSIKEAARTAVALQWKSFSKDPCTVAE